MSRGAWIQLFLFLHVLGAISAVGPTLTYGLWLARADRAGAEQRAFTLSTISWVDNHLATPSFMLQAVTGVALVLLAKFRFFHTAWLITGVAVYVAMTVFAIIVYAPVVKRQVALAGMLAEDPANAGLAAQYREVASRARIMGITAIVLTMAILYFMIVKPTLWSAG